MKTPSRHFAFAALAGLIVLQPVFGQTINTPSPNAYKDTLRKSTENETKGATKAHKKRGDADYVSPVPTLPPAGNATGSASATGSKGIDAPTSSATGYGDPCDIKPDLPQCAKK